MFDVITKKLLADYFKISSARPEDWTASSPCHLHRPSLFCREGCGSTGLALLFVRQCLRDNHGTGVPEWTL